MFKLGKRVRILRGEYNLYTGEVEKPLGEFPFPKLVGVKLDYPNISDMFEPHELEEIRRSKCTKPPRLGS